MIRVLAWSVPIAVACAALVLALPAYPQDMTPHEGTGAAVGAVTSDVLLPEGETITIVIYEALLG